MGILFVARSVRLGRWASDVGLGKHVYKVGVAEGDPKPLAAAGWAGETDWTVVRKREAEGLGEEEAISRLGRKEKMIDPNLYPNLRAPPAYFDSPREGREPHHRHPCAGRRQRPSRTQAEAHRFR